MVKIEGVYFISNRDDAAAALSHASRGMAATKAEGDRLWAFVQEGGGEFAVQVNYKVGTNAGKPVCAPLSVRAA